MNTLARHLMALALSTLVIAANKTDAPRAEQAQLGDPWLPPAARQRDATPSPAGAALDARAIARLQQRFNAADRLGKRSLSKADAQAAGLGMLVQHFEQIDRRGTGRVSFAEVTDFLRARAEATEPRPQ